MAQFWGSEVVPGTDLVLELTTDVLHLSHAILGPITGPLPKGDARTFLYVNVNGEERLLASLSLANESQRIEIVFDREDDVSFKVKSPTNTSVHLVGNLDFYPDSVTDGEDDFSYDEDEDASGEYDDGDSEDDEEAPALIPNSQGRIKELPAPQAKNPAQKRPAPAAAPADQSAAKKPKPDGDNSGSLTCTQCPKTCKGAQALADHMASKHGEKKAVEDKKPSEAAADKPNPAQQPKKPNTPQQKPATQQKPNTPQQKPSTPQQKPNTPQQKPNTPQQKPNNKAPQAAKKPNTPQQKPTKPALKK